MENSHHVHNCAEEHGGGLRRQLDLGGDFSAAAEMFRLLDDASRIRIFWLLCHTEACVTELSAMTGMSPPAVSHHLRQLRDAGLAFAGRAGKEMRYRAADTPACKLLHHAIEKIMEISCPGPEQEEAPERQRFTGEQIESVRRMHDELLAHPEQRLTIHELAKKYLMNPTTLKDCFKAVYGDSLALHMKEHRLEKAAELLRRSEDSVGAIAAAVGYDSPSRFSAAFRARYHLLPSEYRRQMGKTE